jgi:hypothetical protein
MSLVGTNFQLFDELSGDQIADQIRRLQAVKS